VNPPCAVIVPVSSTTVPASRPAVSFTGGCVVSSPAIQTTNLCLSSSASSALTHSRSSIAFAGGRLIVPSGSSNNGNIVSGSYVFSRDGAASVGSTISGCRQPDDPQTVPCLDVTSSPGSPSDDPRLEHKRARNRVAAQRCRIRKMERISELSERVRELRGENDRLALVSHELHGQVDVLKRQILEHVGGGCQVMLAHGAPPS
jgi:hypothetical protein